MKRKHSRFLSLAFFLIGIFFLLNSKTDITGAVVGISNISSGFGSVFGIVFILVSVILFVGGESLEGRLKGKNQWEKYPINKDSIIQDVVQEYLLNSQEEYKRSPIQERIERMVTGGKTIGIPNKRRTYEEQFYEGHASQGGRVIDVPGHIANSGKNKGKLIHFGQSANARYLWVVDEDGNFIVANRQTFKHEMDNINKIDERHRLHKLPHATLAKGKKIYGAGEVLVEGGLIKEVNTHSGHYLPVTITPGRNPGIDEISLIEKFNQQGKKVFEEFSKKYGWREVKNGATYV